MEHAELNGRIDVLCTSALVDELSLRRLKKQRLTLRDQILRLELENDPDEPA